MNKENNTLLALAGLPVVAIVTGSLSFALAWWTAVPASWMWNYHIGPALGMKPVTWQVVAGILLLVAACHPASYPRDYAKREREYAEVFTDLLIRLGFPWLAYVLVRLML